MLENNDSYNGGLAYLENTEVLKMTKEEILAKIAIPNGDVTVDHIDIMMSKPRMNVQKKLKISRHGNIQKHSSNTNES